MKEGLIFRMKYYRDIRTERGKKIEFGDDEVSADL